MASEARVAYGGELPLEMRTGPRRLAAGRRQPAGEGADREPRGKADQRRKRVLGDEEVVESPAGAGDREAAPDAAEGAGQRGDQDAGCDRDARPAVGPVARNVDGGLQDDPDRDRGHAARLRGGADRSPLQGFYPRHA